MWAITNHNLDSAQLAKCFTKMNAKTNSILAYISIRVHDT